MFPRLVTLVPVAVLAAIATAAPSALEARNGYTCNTGNVYCCNTQTIPSGNYNAILGALLNIILSVGSLNIQCDPIVNILGTGAQCTQQAVCCNNNQIVSLIDLSCTPISANL